MHLRVRRSDDVTEMSSAAAVAQLGRLPRSLRHECPIRATLGRLCCRLGGRLVRVAASDFKAWTRALWRTEGWYPAPASSSCLAIYAPKRAIIYSGDASWVDMLHEMGHLFAGPEDPTSVEEFDFLGWEVAIAKRLGLPTGLDAWIRGNRDYGVEWQGQLMEIGEMGAPARNLLLEERLVRARALGLLGRGDAPLSRFRDAAVARVADSFQSPVSP